MQRAHVLVTGGNGHLGHQLVRTLRARGHRVRASIRDLSDESKARRLRALDVELVQADLTQPDTWGPACEGVDVVVHSAAVFDTTTTDPKGDLWVPNIEGTGHVIRAAAAASVRRVVYTSSVAAVGTIEPGLSPLDESSWNERAIEPYAQSKREGEREAWRVSKTVGIDLVAVLPSTMLGPGFTPTPPRRGLSQRPGQESSP